MFDQMTFYLKWLLPIFTIASLCGCIWFMLDSKIQLEELDKRNGRIVHSKFTNDDSGSCFEIYVNNGDLIFLNSNWESKFDRLNEKQLTGMNIEYYYKLNRRTKIFPYQLKIDNDIVIDLSEKKEVWVGFSFFWGGVFILHLIGLILRICYVKRQDGNPTCGLIKSFR